MKNKSSLGIALWALLLAASAMAQDDAWSGLARTQFDSTNLVLRIPCALLKDGTGNPIPGFAPAYGLNLMFDGSVEGQEKFTLTEPIKAFEQVPASCLDSLVVDGNVATYRTTSAEVDIDAAVFADRFYTLELRAELAGGSIDFSVVSAESRLYQRPNYVGEVGLVNVGPPPFTRDLVYDDEFFEVALNTLEQGLAVFEAGRIENTCTFDDPEGLLETVSLPGSSVGFRLKSSITAADNDKLFKVVCTVFNHDINRLETTVELIFLVIRL